MNDRGDFPAIWLLNPLHQTYSKSIIVPAYGSANTLLRPVFLQQNNLAVRLKKLLITLG